MQDLLPDEDSIFPEANIIYSTFWDRLGAYLLDGLFLALATLPLTYFNIRIWKIPSLFVIISLFTVMYKPFLEYRYGATWGKMMVGLQVVGRDFRKITLKEELRRVGFYLIPSILEHLFTLLVYYSTAFQSINNYSDFNRYLVSTNPAILWIDGIVFILVVADTITFFATHPNRSLHDIYAGTYVIERNH
jgi:uncharacterized RDD family membrane protein YckC